MGQRPHAEYREAQTGLTEEEKSASLFQPDILVSGEYFGTLRRKTFLQPEKKLMLAILEDAINCLKDNSSAQTGKHTRIFREAEQWVLGVGDDWLFGFESICETLELNPEYMRNGLRRRKEKKHQISAMPLRGPSVSPRRPLYACPTLQGKLKVIGDQGSAKQTNFTNNSIGF